jgi:hypothetical protein
MNELIKFKNFFHFSFFSDDVDPGELTFFDIPLENNYEDDENSFQLRLPCFLHSLQLCIREGLKNATYIPKVLKNVKHFLKYLINHRKSLMHLMI